MNKKMLDQLILQMENYLECWKQFNHFLNIARAKKFGEEDENQFLEIKSVLAQQLELILASIECTNPTREEVHSLISAAPSIRYLSELNDGAIRGVENQWHKIYIGWQSNLGQLKVKQRELENQGGGGFSLFGRKK
ncbi:MAG TPA: hypothetical protein DCY13_18600 [Verrucomicrobiales bacterium]|nr:hypothetical protein [Verrucomicrobiales bacterium]